MKGEVHPTKAPLFSIHTRVPRSWSKYDKKYVKPVKCVYSNNNSINNTTTPPLRRHPNR
jgi:hypothetical protein